MLTVYSTNLPVLHDGIISGLPFSRQTMDRSCFDENPAGKYTENRDVLVSAQFQLQRIIYSLLPSKTLREVCWRTCTSYSWQLERLKVAIKSF